MGSRLAQTDSTPPFLPRWRRPARRPRMALFAERQKNIDTENAFKIGPYIREVEDAGHTGHQVQPRRARLPAARAHPRGGEAPARPRPDPLLRPAGHPAAARGHRHGHGRAPRPRHRPRPGGGLPRRQAAHRLLPAGLLQPRRRGGLPQPRLPHLRVVHRATSARTPVPLPPRRGERLQLHRRRPRAAASRRGPGSSSSTSPPTRPAGWPRRSSSRTSPR